MSDAPNEGVENPTDKADLKGQGDAGVKGADDISAGPLANRGCTDVWCLLVFIFAWVVFVGVVGMGMKDGNPSKLYSPRDYRGDYCGVEKQWNSIMDVSNHKKLIHMMNLTMMVDDPAKEFVCSVAAKTELTTLLTPTQLEKYMCACCLTPCSTCAAVFDLEHLPTAAAAAAKTSARMKDMTDSSRVGSLFSASGPNAGSFNDIYSKATQYFYQVCVTSCDDALYNSSTAVPMRAYTYSPPPDVTWRDAWKVLLEHPGVSPSMKETMQSAFAFRALPLSLCPYQEKYCVPLPGTAFSELTAGYCTFQVSPGALAAMGKTAEMLNVDEISAAGYEGMGSAMGDVLDTIDSFVVVSVIAFVSGFVFLILLRFMIGVVVWGSVFGVFFAFMCSGGAMYVRAGQCSGTSFKDTGKNYGVSAASVASNQVQGNSITSDESISGNGANYRGQQTRTRGARSCQKWSDQSPHKQTTAAAYPNATAYGLVKNYCRNPIGSVYIWCYTTDPQVRWELCDPIGVHPWDHNCPNGYKVPDENQRKMLEVFGYILWGLGAIWCLVVCCMWSRIKLAVALNKVAAKFLFNTPQIILVPIVQAIVCIIWNVFWAFCASFILSQVADGYVPSKAFTSYQIAAGTVDTPGKCTGTWPSGFAWKYEGNVLVDGDSCSGNKGDTSELALPACWRCMPPRFMLDYRFAYVFFMYLWANMFLIAVGQMTIAGACGVWFFAAHDAKSKQKSVRVGLRNSWRYHLGSLALGSFIIAAVQFIRYCIKYFEKQASAQKNRVMVIVLKVLGYLIWCFEKCLKFITKNAYIQIALVGKNFCQSAKAAFSLITRNMIRFGVMAMLGGVVNWLGIALIMAITLFVGYYVLEAMHPTVSPVMPMFLFAMMAYVVARLFMMVFHLACDTMMQCFILTEDMGREKADGFVPAELRNMIPDKE